MTTKVIVTGSRDWTDSRLVFVQLGIFFVRAPGSFLVVQGGHKKGADKFAREWASAMRISGQPVDYKTFEADWDNYGIAAGPIRNTEMVKFGADLCLAFIKDNSRGASDCALKAENAGIRTWRFTA